MDDGTRTLLNQCEQHQFTETSKQSDRPGSLDNGSRSSGKDGVDDGTRTHDDRDHNPGLYQLSYAHHGISNFSAACAACAFPREEMARPTGLATATRPACRRASRSSVRTTVLILPVFKLARPAGFEPATAGLAYQLPLSRPRSDPGLWSGLSLRHLRRRTYSLYGSQPMIAASTGFHGIAISITC